MAADKRQSAARQSPRLKIGRYFLCLASCARTQVPKAVVSVEPPARQESKFNPSCIHYIQCLLRGRLHRLPGSSGAGRVCRGFHTPLAMRRAREDEAVGKAMDQRRVDATRSADRTSSSSARVGLVRVALPTAFAMEPDATPSLGKVQLS